MIPRTLSGQIHSRLFSGKAIIVLGPRQTGKTTLLRSIMEAAGKPAIFLNCDDPFVQAQLTGITLATWQRLIGNAEIVFVDEAQRIPNLGLSLKLVTDQMPGVQLLVSGSSALELASGLSEPLTGRKWEYRLFPISWLEWENHVGYFTATQQLETRILYGMYPEIINYPGEERDRLGLLVSSYLYKDILALGSIRRPELLDNLLRALAFQVGNEVTYNELSKLLGADKATISQYIDLLEKAFILFRLPSYSRNLRKEISLGRKIYFYDTGILNTLLANFSPLLLRKDRVAIWENFVVAERQKQLSYTQSWANSYFWRTHDQQEIDYLEEKDGKLRAWEIKWSPEQHPRSPKAFSAAYPNAEFQEVNPRNFVDFLSAP